MCKKKKYWKFFIALSAYLDIIDERSLDSSDWSGTSDEIMIHFTTVAPLFENIWSRSVKFPGSLMPSLHMRFFEK